MFTRLIGNRHENSGIYPFCLGSGPSGELAVLSGGKGQGYFCSVPTKRNLVKKFGLVLFLVLLGVCLLRGQPVNDSIQGAIFLDISSTPIEVEIDLANTTLSMENIGCSVFRPANYLWYKYDSDGTELVAFETQSNSNRPFTVQVIRPMTDESYQCLRQVSLSSSRKSLGVVPEGEVFLRVVDYLDGEHVGTISFQQSPLPPPNDDPANAILIEVNEESSTTVFDLIGATPTFSESSGPQDCRTYSRQDVWYKFNSSGGDLLHCRENQFRGFSIYRQVVGNTYERVDCNQNNQVSRIENLPSGLLFIRCTGVFPRLELRQYLPSSFNTINDEFPGAISIVPSDGGTDFLVDVWSATNSNLMYPSLPNSALNDVWYTFMSNGGDISIEFDGSNCTDINLCALVQVDESGTANVVESKFRSRTMNFTNVPEGPLYLTFAASEFNNIRKFYDNFTISQAGALLPVTLTTFTATARQKSTLLNWQTASETGNYYFAVERSADGQTFTAIGEVAGAGTSQTVQEYTFTDNTPQPGTNFYRLRQVDFDGTATLSEVRAVAFAIDNLLRVYPNPVGRGAVTVQIPENLKYQPLEVMTMDGRRVLKQSGELNGFSTAALAAGVYLVRVGELVERLVVR